MTGQGPSDQHLHLSKKLTIGYLLVMLGMVGGVLMYFNTMDKRVSENSISIKYLSEEQGRAAARIETLRIEQRQDFQNINEKLDQIIQNRNR